MRSSISAALLLVVTGALFACKPAPEPEPVAEEEAAEDTTADSGGSLIEACTIKMASPEANEWTTYWDTSAAPSDGEGPSAAHSLYWGSQEEKAELARTSGAIPLTIRCTADGPPAIAVSLSAYTSTEKEIPMSDGEYEVVGKTQGDLPPGLFMAAPVMFGERIFTVDRGTLNVDHFDSSGVRGRFSLSGTENGEGGESVEIEGSFDIPCRGGTMESACEGTRTER
jgi:hypothetical protein